MCVGFIAMMIPCSAETQSIIEIEDFLINDTTDQNELLPWYTCGHYSRDLARNASEHNLTIGSVMLSNHPVFRGKWNSHLMNYFTVNGTIYLIEPQTDMIKLLGQSWFQYYRLYPDGTQIPTYWKSNLAHTGKIGEVLY